MEVDNDWLRLIHYHKSTWGYKSNVDDLDFFKSKDGKDSPEKELAANIELFNQKNTEYLCKYPARSKYLARKLNQDFNIHQYQCKLYEEYLKDHFPKKVHLVFSSYYVESPASAFGHTFLRFSKNDDWSTDKKSELLDTGINYGAVVTTENPLLYTLFGAMGGFKGTFSAIPYFYKIREYNDYESRDLWSYQLNLTENEKLILLDNLWELGGTWYYYYFFTGNCSQKILELLDSINPDWKFLDKLPFYIIPAETLKVVNNTPNLVDHISFRPSKRKLFLSAYSQLTNFEKEEFRKIIDSKNLDLISLVQDNISRTKILDVVIEFLDYKYSKEILFEKGKMYDWKIDILKKRSELNFKGISLDYTLPKEELPHLSHPPGKFKLQYFYDSKNKTKEGFLSHRFALHDFSDPTMGSPKLSSISFFKTDFSFSKNKFTLSEFAPVEVSTLNPWGNYFYPISLTGKLAYLNQVNGFCSSCKIIAATVASGPSWSFLNDSFIVYSFLNSDLLFSNEFTNHHFDLNLGLLSGFVYRFDHSKVLNSKIRISKMIFNKQTSNEWINNFQSMLNERIGINAETNFSKYQRKFGIGLNYFY
jgi:hypothetical protein